MAGARPGVLGPENRPLASEQVGPSCCRTSGTCVPKGAQGGPRAPWTSGLLLLEPSRGPLPPPRVLPTGHLRLSKPRRDPPGSSEPRRAQSVVGLRKASPGPATPPAHSLGHYAWPMRGSSLMLGCTGPRSPAALLPGFQTGTPGLGARDSTRVSQLCLSRPGCCLGAPQGFQPSPKPGSLTLSELC